MKDLRLRTGLTLRVFCTKNGFDPGNYSRIERGVAAPPKEGHLSRYAQAVGLTLDSDDWVEFFDLAAIARGEIPQDLLDDAQLVGKLPVLFRTVRGDPAPSDKMDALSNEIRRG
jgi:transcriptional regulator with XRE-family HTH domain